MTTDATPASPDQRPKQVALVALFVVFLAFNFPVLTGKVLFPVDQATSVPPISLYDRPAHPANSLEGDAFTLYYPLRVYLGERLRKGDLPLWDPYRFAGTPFAANSQTGSFYPPNWLHAVGSGLSVYSLLLLLHRLAALLLAYWFFRVLRLHPFAACLGAIVFTFSGFLIAWGVHATFPATAIWLPLALGGVHIANTGHPRRGIPLAALGLALSVLGGHPQVAIYVWLATAVWALVHALAQMIDRRGNGARSMLATAGGGAIRTGVIFFLGAGIASLQVLSSLEFSGDTIRGLEEYGMLRISAIPSRHLVTFLVPDYFGNPVDGNSAAHINYTESALYAGLPALLLVSITVWRRRDRATAGFAAIGMIGAAAAFGTPLFRAIYDFVPGVDRIRSPGRFVFLLDTALAGAAALGLDELISRRTRMRLIWIPGALLLTVLLLARTIIEPEPAVGEAYLTGRLLRAAGIILASVLAAAWLVRQLGRTLAVLPIVAVTAGDLWLFGFRYHQFHEPAPLYPEVPEVEYLRSVAGTRPRIIRVGEWWLPHNSALVHRLYDAQGYDNFIPRRYVELVSIAQDQHINARVFNVVYNVTSSAIFAPVLDLLGVRAVLAARDEPGLPPQRFRSGFKVVDQPGAFPLAFLAGCWEFLPEAATGHRLAAMSQEDLRSIAIVNAEDARRVSKSMRKGECVVGGEVRVTQYEPERVVLRIDAQQSAIVVVADSWDRDWEAEVDGEPAPLLRVDLALRGIQLSPGTHTVEMRYRPGWLPAGIAITLTSLIASAAYLFGTDRLLRLRSSLGSSPSGSRTGM